MAVATEDLKPADQLARSVTAPMSREVKPDELSWV